MSPEADGSLLVSLVWLAWFYWVFYCWVDQMSSSRKDPRGTPKENLFSSAGQRLDTTSAAADNPAPSSPPAGAVSSPGNVLAEIAQHDRSFAVADFLSNASAAYEQITLAFAEGNRQFLRQSVSDDVYRVFASVIDAREARSEEADIRFVSIAPPEVVHARIRDGEAELTLRMSAELFDVTRNAAGHVIHGDPMRIVETNDLWTFAKPLSAREPAWMLVATS